MPPRCNRRKACPTLPCHKCLQLAVRPLRAMRFPILASSCFPRKRPMSAKRFLPSCVITSIPRSEAKSATVRIWSARASRFKSSQMSPNANRSLTARITSSLPSRQPSPLPNPARLKSLPPSWRPVCSFRAARRRALMTFSASSVALPHRECSPTCRRSPSRRLPHLSKSRPCRSRTARMTSPARSGSSKWRRA